MSVCYVVLLVVKERRKKNIMQFVFLDFELRILYKILFKIYDNYSF